MKNAAAPSEAGAWSPLREPTFRALWLAVLVGNVGTWIHDVAAAWVMAETTGSAFMVAAVQAATTLPVVLLALLAGALADIVDKRRYLILAQAWMLLVAGALAILAYYHLLTPWLLVGLTFALGAGAAMATPAQQAITPELVPRPLLAPAVALGSLSMNIARSIGPALGGLILARWSVALAFAINAVSFLGIILVLLFWKRAPTREALPPEHFGSALRAGLRYATHASTLQAVLVKAGMFFGFASAFTAMLPIVVKQDLGAGAGTYGILLGCIGAGAVAGAIALPRLRSRVAADGLILGASLAYALAMVALALLRHVASLYVVSVIAGFAWISVLSSFHIAAQTSLPAWVRARALSLYIVVFSGGLALGSLGWGVLAERTSASTALLAAAAGAALAALAGARFKVGRAAAADVTPSHHWPTPLVEAEVAHDRGPVLVTIEYQVANDQRGAFLDLMQPLGRSRRRDGAFEWGIVEDTAHQGTFLEYFLTSSWIEHLRQHDRVTHDDQELQARVRALQRPGTQPRVRHFVGSASALPVPLPVPSHPAAEAEGPEDAR